jgi:hypothetical protein
LGIVTSSASNHATIKSMMINRAATSAHASLRLSFDYRQERNMAPIVTPAVKGLSLGNFVQSGDEFRILQH